jgi:hypothetical protein
VTADWVEVYRQERRRPGYVIENGKSMIRRDEADLPRQVSDFGCIARHGAQGIAPPGPSGPSGPKIPGGSGSHIFSLAGNQKKGFPGFQGFHAVRISSPPGR